jgi:molecular chaperone GrpE (heat shock protein)
VNFEMELEKLLAREQDPLPQGELVELIGAGQSQLAALNKKQTDLSLQVEEIYDLVKEADTQVLQEALEAEKSRVHQLVEATLGLCDMLEDFCAYAEQSGSEALEHQGCLLWKNSSDLLESCGITRLGAAGQPLDPKIHKVQAVAAASIPREHVVRVLQSGYRYLGTVLRKAVVIVSSGMEDTEIE